MKKSSYQRELVYQNLTDQLSEKVIVSPHSQASSSKYIRLFCMYLANYSEKKSIQEVDHQVVKDYFSYLTKDHKRLSLTLTDIKKSMQMISETLNIELEQSMNDFSLSNSHLWNKLK
ncbi:swarming motility protein SwrAA [Metabacillus litoralis]|uniref:swarming motility protein SwrAA n=1 Tax=Metabacillus litoralis TaxID=152268 RepID=UPI001CFDF330|nr:swarming motility protein SwrAA [Metabacillus litoralis]